MGVSTIWGTVLKDHSIKKAENHLGSQRMTSGTQKVKQVFSLRQGSLEKPSVMYLINLRRCCSNLNVAHPSQVMYSSSWGSCLGRLRNLQGLKPLWKTWVDVGRLWVLQPHPAVCFVFPVGCSVTSWLRFLPLYVPRHGELYPLRVASPK